MTEIIEIKLSKGKIILLFLAAITFVILGCFLAIKPENFVSTLLMNPEAIRISGILGVLFFGVGIIFIARKLFDNKPGLIIDQYGITDNTNATSIGLIEWKDIIGIE